MCISQKRRCLNSLISHAGAIFAPCKPMLRRKKNDCFAVQAGIQQNNDNIYENTDLEFACNLTSLVTIFLDFSMDVELQLTPIFS